VRWAGKSKCTLAGVRLTFLKQGWLQRILVGASGIFLKAKGSEIFAFRCEKEFWLVYHGVHWMSRKIHRILTCSVCLLMMQSECVWALGDGSNFQLVRGPQNWVLGPFQTEGAVWPKCCVDFEALFTHGSEIDCHMGDSYLKHATLKW